MPEYIAQSTEKPEVGGSYNIQEVVNLYKKCKNQKWKRSIAQAFI